MSERKLTAIEERELLASGECCLVNRKSLDRTIEDVKQKSARILALETELAEARKEIAKSDGLGMHCKDIRMALADALIWILGELPSAPHEGSCGGPNNLCDQECADVANAYGEYQRLFNIKNNPPHYFESKASEALKDSARLTKLSGFLIKRPYLSLWIDEDGDVRLADEDTDGVTFSGKGLTLSMAIDDAARGAL